MTTLVVAIFCVPWVWLNYWGSLTPEQKHAKQFPIPYWAIGMGVIAFGVWSLTIPETPFLQWHRWDLKFAPFVTLVGVTLLTIADRIRAAVKERETPLPQQLSG